MWLNRKVQYGTATKGEVDNLYELVMERENKINFARAEDEDQTTTNAGDDSDSHSDGSERFFPCITEACCTRFRSCCSAGVTQKRQSGEHQEDLVDQLVRKHGERAV